MAKIRKLYDEAIKPDGTKQTVYPITSTRAVYTPSNVTLDTLLNEGYRFMGEILPNTLPTPDQKVCYLAQTAGNYVDGSIVLPIGKSCIITYDGQAWGNIPIDDIIYIAQYGVTSGNDIGQAVAAGKVIYCRVENADLPAGWKESFFPNTHYELVPLRYYITNNFFIFEKEVSSNGQTRYLRCGTTGSWFINTDITNYYTKPFTGIPESDLAPGVIPDIVTIAEIDALFSGGGGGSGSGSESGGGGSDHIDVLLDKYWTDIVDGSSGSFDIAEDKTLFGLDTFDKWSNVLIFDYDQYFVSVESLVSYSDSDQDHCTARVTIENPETLDTYDIVFEWQTSDPFGFYRIEASS